MNINCTLIVQIFNFFITYKFLSALIFKPALAIFTADKNKIITIKNQLLFEEQTIEAKEEQARVQLHSFQLHVKEEHTISSPPVTLPCLSVEYHRNQQEINELTAQLEDVIISKVTHVH